MILVGAVDITSGACLVCNQLVVGVLSDKV